MSTFKGAAITETRIYDDPANPQSSPYRVSLPITVLSAVRDPDTGKGLDQILEEMAKVPVPAVDPVLANNSWEVISDVSRNFIAKHELTALEVAIHLGWQIGDEITFNLNGTLSGVEDQPITMQIYDFNHDDLADGSGKAGITFGMKGLMMASDMNANGTRRMEETNTNANSFIGSEMGIWLNGALFDMFPSDVKAAIKDVNKKASAGSQSTTIRTDAMKVFLFSVSECFGTTGTLYGVPGEGEQYPIFTDNASRIKLTNNGTGSANGWWERSPRRSDSTCFCIVNANGAAYLSNASSAYRVCLGFCV